MQIHPKETSMKRILLLMVLAAGLALATGSTALAKRHATKSSPVSGQPAATASCPDPAHCPFGSCPLGTKATATATTASVPAAGKGAACSDPTKCTPACRPGSSGATAAAVTKQ
jgi:hypothetical protein